MQQLPIDVVQRSRRRSSLGWGLRDARRFCVNHGLSAEDTQLVVWLVEHHLTMSSVAQKKDLSDPAVIADFAQLVANERRLTALVQEIALLTANREPPRHAEELPNEMNKGDDPHPT